MVPRGRVKLAAVSMAVLSEKVKADLHAGYEIWSLHKLPAKLKKNTNQRHLAGFHDVTTSLWEFKALCKHFAAFLENELHKLCPGESINYHNLLSIRTPFSDFQTTVEVI